MAGVRLAQEGVLAHDIGGLDGALHGRVRNFRCHQAGCGGQGYRPGPFEFLPDQRDIDALVAGIHVRQASGVARSLHIVLPPQRIDAGVGTADISRHQGEIRNGVHVCRSLGLLGDPHGVIHGRPARSTVQPGRPDDIVLRNSRHTGALFRREFLKGLFPGIEARRALSDETFIDHSFAHDDMGEGIQQNAVRSGLELQPDIGNLAEVDPPGIGNDDARTLAAGLEHHVRDDGMGLLGVRTDDEEHVRVFDLPDRIRHSAGTEQGGQTGHRRSVSEPGAVIDVVRADHRAHYLLEQEILFRRTPR